jgi:DNA-binding transcriptional LysR family regulator
MNLWQLHVFCKVIEFKNFSKAGQHVNLSQPTISSHVKELEDYFNCRLIDRMGKEALPTKAGALLYGYARRLMLLSDETKSAMETFIGEVAGRLAIGGSTIPGGFILPRIIGKFKKIHHEVSVSISIGDTKKIIDDVLTGFIELGIVGAKTSIKGMLQEKLVEDEMHLIVPSGHRWASLRMVTVEMLKEEPFITREQGSGTLESIKISLSRGRIGFEEFNVVAEIGSTTAVIQGIKSGIGVSILSPIAVQEELKAGFLAALKVKGIDLRRSFYLTRHSQRTVSPVAQAFIRFIKKELSKQSSA